MSIPTKTYTQVGLLLETFWKSVTLEGFLNGYKNIFQGKEITASIESRTPNKCWKQHILRGHYGLVPYTVMILLELTPYDQKHIYWPLYRSGLQALLY